jgi:plasmid stability protein
MEDFQMPVNLSVKNAPDQVVKRLKARAARHHRSLQGELMAILEAAAYDEPRPLTPRAVLAQVRAAGIATPSSSARIIRASRDGRAARRRR